MAQIVVLVAVEQVPLHVFKQAMLEETLKVYHGTGALVSRKYCSNMVSHGFTLDITKPYKAIYCILMGCSWLFILRYITVTVTHPLIACH